MKYQQSRNNTINNKKKYSNTHSRLIIPTMDDEVRESEYSEHQ